MRRWRAHTEPSAAEVAGLTAGLGEGRRWAEATAPTGGEVERVRPRVGVARGGAPGWVVPGAILAVAAAVFLGVRAAPDRAALAVPAGQVIEVVATRRLDAVWSVEGEARVRVARAEDGSLQVEVDRGDLTFVAEGRGAPLEVRAGPTVARAGRGRFAVARSAARTTIRVADGAVELVAPEARRVAVGEAWTWPPAQAEAAPRGPTPAGRPSAAPTFRVHPGPAGDVATPAPREDAAAAMAALLARREAGEGAGTLLPAVDAWLAAHPGGPLAAEMAFVQLELRVAAASPEAAVAELDAWIAAHPGDPRLVDAGWLRAEVASTRLGGCHAASGAYAWLADHGSPESRAEARRLRDACR